MHQIDVCVKYCCMLLPAATQEFENKRFQVSPVALTSVHIHKHQNTHTHTFIRMHMYVTYKLICITVASQQLQWSRLFTAGDGNIHSYFSFLRYLRFKCVRTSVYMDIILYAHNYITLYTYISMYLLCLFRGAQHQYSLFNAAPNVNSKSMTDHLVSKSNGFLTFCIFFSHANAPLAVFWCRCGYVNFFGRLLMFRSFVCCTAVGQFRW